MGSDLDPSYVLGRRVRRSSQVDRRVSEWFETGAGDLEQRLNSQDYQPLSGNAGPRSIPMASSTWSSIAPSAQSRGSYPGSAQVPSLTNYGSTVGSDFSDVWTGSAADQYQPMLVDTTSEEGDVVRDQRPATWQCPFVFLGCSQMFGNVAHWDMHCRTHLRNQLPRHVECPFLQCGWEYTGPSGQDAWRDRWAHVVAYHTRGGLAEPRASRSMIQHLYASRLIDNAEEQELRGSATGPYTVSSSTSRRRDRYPGSNQFPRSG
ncbi:unnamed protein product [Cercospora beticola]|nr:unnamed protein product [Cercospora beticola]